MKNIRGFKIKKILLSIFCMLIPFFMLACSPITLTTRQYNNGLVQMNLEFSVENLDISDKTKIIQIANGYIDGLNSAYLDNFYSLFSQQYSSKLNGFLDLNEEQKLAYILQNFSNFSVVPNNLSDTGETIIDRFVMIEGNTMRISCTFMSIYAYILYFNPSAYVYDSETNTVIIDSENYGSLIDVPVSSVSIEEERKLFTIDAIQTCSPFSYDGGEAVLLEDLHLSGSSSEHLAGERLVDVIVSELSLDEGEAELVFEFITPYSRLHSDGDIVDTDDGLVHTWNLGSDIMGEIKLWRTSANQVTYYVLGILLGLLIIGIGVIVMVIQNKKKKKEGIELLKKVDDLVSNREV